MKTCFDVIFVILNVILFAINFHCTLESNSFKSCTYHLRNDFCHCSYNSNRNK